MKRTCDRQVHGLQCLFTLVVNVRAESHTKALLPCQTHAHFVSDATSAAIGYSMKKCTARNTNDIDRGHGYYERLLRKSNHTNTSLSLSANSVILNGSHTSSS